MINSRLSNLLLFWFVEPFLKMNVKEFSVHVFHCSVIKVPVLRQPYQIITSFLACQELFFIFLKISFFKIFQFFSTALIDYHKPFCLSRTFFKFFNLKTVSGERGILTLARREPSTPLAGAPLQPLEYFSIA